VTSKQGRSDNVDTQFSGQDEMLNVDEEAVVVEEINKRRNVVDEVAKVIKTAQVSVVSAKVSSASATTTTTTTEDDLTLAQALAELMSTKPKAKGLLLERQIDEEEIIARAKEEKIDEVNITWDDIQAKVDVDYQLAQRLVSMFVDYRTDLVEGSSKRARDELEQEVIKKQKVDDVQETAKVDDDQEAAKIKELMEIVPDEEEVAINAIPLTTKPPTIVDWKIHKEGKKKYYQIIRADGSSNIPVKDLDLILWGYLKTMFEPHVEDRVWRNQQDYIVLDWKLYDSCGVHSLRMQHMHIYMLVEKRYPLTPASITDMLNKKLQADHFSEMAYQLLKLLTKQLKNQ
ncbi:hypothetical protein Tco_1487939, partial [Tanacetum coccineum]